MSCCKEPTVKTEFKNGTPNFKFDQEPVKLFEAEDGLLYRLVNKKKHEWAYYNDSTGYTMNVNVTFKEDCDIQALGNTTLKQLGELREEKRVGRGECVGEVTVAPGCTELFIKGHVNGFDAKVDAIPVA